MASNDTQSMLPKRRMTRSASLTAAGYAVCLLAAGIPLVEAAVAGYPFSPGATQWRFGTVGLFSRVLLLPLLALAFAVGLAFVLEHRRTLRTFAVAAGVSTVLLVLISGLFMLDATEMIARVQPEMRTAFIVASAAALAKLCGITVVTLLITRGAWSASRPHRQKHSVGAEAGLMRLRRKTAKPVSAGV